MADRPPRGERDGTIPNGVRHDDAEKLIVYRRRAVAASMRRSGATYQQIADNAQYPDGERCYPEGTTRGYVFMDVKRGLAEAVRDMRLETAELRELIADRLDDMFLRLQPAIRAGDVKAIDAGRRIQADLAKLFGASEPERHEVITLDAADAALRELNREIAARIARAEGHPDRVPGGQRPQNGDGPG